jgi:hypothetical protein
MAVNERRPAHRVDQRFDVFDLALDRVGRGIAAVAAAAPVVSNDGEVRRKAGGQCGRIRARPERASDQDQRGALARPVVGDGGTIFR